MAESPECTGGREGFYHPVVASGDAASLGIYPASTGGCHAALKFHRVIDFIHE